MDFGAAFTLLMQGRKVTRQGWRGGSWLELKPGTATEVAHPVVAWADGRPSHPYRILVTGPRNLRCDRPAADDAAVTPQQDLKTLIPDLKDIPADRVADLGPSVLADTIARYLERLREDGTPLSSFTARI